MEKPENVRQTEIFTKPIKACAFSGHRETEKNFDRSALRKAILRLLELGAETFYCGMAMGFDLIAAEEVLEIKKRFPSVRLSACVPCAEQEKFFPPEEKKKYREILERCDERVVLSDRYYRGCMLKRNDYMEKNADALIAYCRKKTGGTAYTRNLFLKRNKPVFDL